MTQEQALAEIARLYQQLGRAVLHSPEYDRLVAQIRALADFVKEKKP